MSGGFPARAAMVRWSVRMFRREWRRQLLMLILLTIAVAGAVFGVASTYNAAPNDDATFGSAPNLLRYDGDDPADLAQRIDATREWFGTIEVIGHRYAPVPGLFDSLDIRAQEPDGPYGTPMFALTRGRYPNGDGEIALTEQVSATLRVPVGSTLNVDGRSYRVVGLAENPANLDDQFAVVDPATAAAPQTVTVLVGGTQGDLEAFRDTLSGAVTRENRGGNEGTAAALIAMALAAVGMLFVSLVAAAGFVVIAQRRLRQLGLLAAVGATKRHLRLVMLANGAIVGGVAAVAGAGIGLAGWFALAGTVESSARHRIDRFDLPWLIIVSTMALALLTATAAAWWPARRIARMSVMQALSARPAPPRPARRSGQVAVVLIAVGFGALWVGTSRRPAPVIAGILLTAAGMLLLGPLAVRLIAAARRPMPVPLRLALTDLGRYQARSSAALAAISLAVAVAVAIVAGSAAGESIQRRENGVANLADNQVVVRIANGQNENADGPGPILVEHTTAELESMQADVDRIIAALGPSTTVTGLSAVASATEETSNGKPSHPTVELGIGSGGDSLASYPIYVATDDLLRLYGLHANDLDPTVDLVTNHTGDLQLVTPDPIPGLARGEFLRPKTQHVSALGYSSLPRALLTTAAMQRHNWSAVPVGWLIAAGQPITASQVADLRDIAAGAGLTIESSRVQATLTDLRTATVLGGALLAMAVLASTVGLIRGEAAADMRILTALGARRRLRRALTAATAGALALLGTAIGAATAYLVIATILRRQPEALVPVPLTHLLALLVGIPIIATGAAWLLAGQRQTHIARPVAS
jgi:putative ABC transport system permease protein